MNCVLISLQFLAFIGSLIVLGIVTAVVPWGFIFPVIIIAFVAFIILSAISFWSSTPADPNGKRKWRFALVQVKLGSVILHTALLIRFIFGDSSNLEKGYTWALIVLIIGALILIRSAFAQMRSKTTRLSAESAGLGLAATFLALAVCWWAVNEAFYVFYTVFGFWAIFGANKAIPKVNRFALSTKTRLYWTMHLLFFWIALTIIVYAATDDIPILD